MGNTRIKSMEFGIRFPNSIKKFESTVLPFMVFAQRMANRISIGHIRYGKPDRDKLYLSRLKTELRAYQQSGNSEHLFNVANYCFLESQAPENKKFHWGDTTESVTRKKFGGDIQ